MTHLVPRRVDDRTARVARAVVEAAFERDPLWTWALGADTAGSQARHRLWKLIVDGALPHRLTWMTAEQDAVAVWLPPGVPEWDETGDAELADIRRSLAHERAARVAAVFDALAQQRPQHTEMGPAYLSLLAVHPDSQGRGSGTALLGDTLRHIDSRGWSAYLESSAERNVGLYLRHGFEIVARVTPMGSPPITAMARPAAPTSSSVPAR